MESFLSFVHVEFVTILICLLQVEHPANAEKSTLRLVQILFRHGDRSAIHGYPLDPVKESDWPQGYGQLSKVGMAQEFRLGQSMRNLYVRKLNFLKPNYNRTKVFMRSTDMDRTLMSAYCVLAGLFPTQNVSLEWNNTWQPIPVHTVPLQEDYLLSSHAPCPMMGTLHQEFMLNNQQIKDLTREKQWLIQHTAKNSGLSPTIQSVFEIGDPLFCENTHSLINTTSGWLAVNGTFQRIMALKNVPVGLSFPTPKLAKLRSGVLLTEIVSNMKAKLNKTLERDIILYSAHDDTVIGLLGALKYYRYPEFPAVQPQYSTSVTIELHEESPSNFVVKVYLRNETSSTNLHLYPLPIQGCGANCSFPMFTKVLSDMMVTDIRRECAVKTSPNGSSGKGSDNSFVGVAILGALTGFLLVILAGACWIQCKQKNNVAYRPIPLVDES